jgi:hypothetical protein
VSPRTRWFVHSTHLGCDGPFASPRNFGKTLALLIANAKAANPKRSSDRDLEP